MHDMYDILNKMNLLESSRSHKKSADELEAELDAGSERNRLERDPGRFDDQSDDNELDSSDLRNRLERDPERFDEQDVREGTAGQNVTQHPRGSTVFDRDGNSYKVLGYQGRALVLKGTIGGKRVTMFPHQLQKSKSDVQEGTDDQEVSFREMIDAVDQHDPKYYDELAGSDISDEQFKKAIVNAYKEIIKKQGVAEGTGPTEKVSAVIKRVMGEKLIFEPGFSKLYKDTRRSRTQRVDDYKMKMIGVDDPTIKNGRGYFSAAHGHPLAKELKIELTRAGYPVYDDLLIFPDLIMFQVRTPITTTAEQGAAEAKLKEQEMTDKYGMEEGNDFTGARQAAIRAGKPTFTVGGKTYRVTGDTTREKAMGEGRATKEKILWPGTPEYDKKFPANMRTGEKIRTHTGGELEKTATGVRHTARSPEDDEPSDKKSASGEPRRRGRPPGTKRSIGAKGPTGRSKLLKGKSIREGDLELDYDQDEYDNEGEMAISQSRTIVDAAEELQTMIDNNDNLPEWVQKKISLAQEYIDSARDYLKSNQPEEEMIGEKAVSKAQRAAAGIAYAARKGEIPKSELRGASKEMSKMAPGELKKFAKTKEKGLPEKVKEVDTGDKPGVVKGKQDRKKEKPVEETTTSGSVATADSGNNSKKGMMFGKGVYEGQLAESYDARLRQLLSEGMSMSMNVSEDGEKSLTVSATNEDAEKLAEILKLAGLESSAGTCDSCGESPCGCEDLGEGEYANSPEAVQADTDTLINSYSDGLNGKNTTGQTTTPVIAGQTQRMTSQVREEQEQRLWALFKRYDPK